MYSASRSKSKRKREKLRYFINEYSLPRYRILTLDFQIIHVTCYFPSDFFVNEKKKKKKCERSRSARRPCRARAETPTKFEVFECKKTESTSQNLDTQLKLHPPRKNTSSQKGNKSFWTLKLQPSKRTLKTRITNPTQLRLW